MNSCLDRSGVSGVSRAPSACAQPVYGNPCVCLDVGKLAVTRRLQCTADMTGNSWRHIDHYVHCRYKSEVTREERS